MNKSESNPPENQLPLGMKEAELIRSITTSGFPLQGVVAHHLKSKYSVTEEWSYIDRETDILRSLDVFAFRPFHVEAAANPYAVLLIECKSSIHPYVFFKNAVAARFEFPSICGLPLVAIRQRGDSASRYQECSASRILGLNETEFGTVPPICSAFTQAIAQGDKVGVSGTDPFNSIVMPLVKANDHAVNLYDTRSRAKEDSLSSKLILNICVMDAPMVVVGSPDEGQSVRLEPWVRVLRQEAKPEHHHISYRRYAVDIVHRGFLSTFFDHHLEVFFEEYTRRITDRLDVLRCGGWVSDLANWTWSDVTAT